MNNFYIFSKLFFLHFITFYSLFSLPLFLFFLFSTISPNFPFCFSSSFVRFSIYSSLFLLYRQYAIAKITKMHNSSKRIMHNSFFEEISDIFPLYYKVCTFQITAFLFTFFSEKRIMKKNLGIKRLFTCIQLILINRFMCIL